MTRWFLARLRPLVERVPRLAALYRNVRDQLDSEEAPLPTPWGFRLAGNHSMVQGTFEPEETRLVRSLLSDADVFVNVGANIGYYCCHSLSMGKRVIAFEPVQRNLRYLCRNIVANDWDDIEIYPIALANRTGVLKLYGGTTGASILKGWAGIPESYVTIVPSSTLDLVLGDRLQGEKALILIDIEGAEKWMLEGAMKLLASEPRPVWLVEILSTEFQPSGVAMNPHFKDTFQLFFQHGYQAYTADDDMRQITIDEIELIAKGHGRLTTHNFMFCSTKPML